MNVAEYIINYISDKGTKHIFGYPGGMLTYFMEACSRYSDKLTAHICYHEQAAAFCACGYAQVSGQTGVAYATSGPGATNLITGICNAWFDSIPVVFLTGQVNTFESKGSLPIRQKGFQETNIIQMVKGVVKYCKYVESVDEIQGCLEKAWSIANEGRKGPVLLDIPMDIWKSTIYPCEGMRCTERALDNYQEAICALEMYMKMAKRPVVLIGGGIDNPANRNKVMEILVALKLPVVSSMLAVDLFPNNSNYYGFIGAYGNRTANFIVSKSDLVISIGSRLDIRQVGGKKEKFAPNAKLVRVDVDYYEFLNPVKDDEVQIRMDGLDFLFLLKGMLKNFQQNVLDNWIIICKNISAKLKMADQELLPNRLVRKLSQQIEFPCILTTDVGQNQVWVAQSWQIHKGQRILFSGGHGAMGYSLPAAIGAYFGGKDLRVISINGDGGFQMNMQELQFVVRDNLPITIVIFNNQSLGMIRHFQEMYFQGNYVQTTKSSGYSVPDFLKLANAYGLDYHCVTNEKDLEQIQYGCDYPQMIEVRLPEQTYVYPKLEYGQPNQDQEPRIDREIYNYLMSL